MKKLFTSSRWKNYSNKRQQDELERRRHRKIYLTEKRQSALGASPLVKWERQQKSKTKIIPVPANFSLINNTIEVLQFFSRMRETFQKRKNVFVDLKDIKDITPEAVIALLSKLDDKRFTSNMRMSGNAPEDPKLQNLFTQSGFYDYVKSYHKPLASGDSLILPEKSRDVESETADAMVRFATTKLFGSYRVSPGIQKTLVECMTNTHNHAAKNRPYREKWWAAVHYDKKHRKAQFVFIDNGVGIFRSEEMGIVLAAAKLLSFENNADILREMLRGNRQSRTKLSYRGYGLPTIYKSLQRKQFSNLIIITNDVYANVTNDDFKPLRHPFNGTFFYWELSHD